MQVCTSLQTDNHASTVPLSFLQAGCLSCRPTNSVKALKAQSIEGTPGTQQKTYNSKVWQVNGTDRQRTVTCAQTLLRTQQQTLRKLTLPTSLACPCCS